MRTEEYIIILVGIVADSKEVTITYTSNSPQNNVSVRVTYSNGKTIKQFEQVREAVNGTLRFSSEGLFPGTYTCSILVDGAERDSKTFSLK